MDGNKFNTKELTVVLPHDQWEAMLKSMDSNRQRKESVMSILDAGDRSRIDFILDDLCTLASMVESELSMEQVNTRHCKRDIPSLEKN